MSTGRFINVANNANGPPRFARNRNTGPQAARQSRLSIKSQRINALTDRLEEALVFIIHQDGAREYKTMTLRELYNYVLKAIATRPEGVPHSTHSLMRATVAPELPSVLEVKKRPAGESFVSSLGSDQGSSVSGNLDGNDGGECEEAPVGSSDENKMAEQTPTTEGGHDDNDTEEREQRKKVTFMKPPSLTSRGRSGSIGGPAGPCASENVTYRERLGGYLHPRDMRRLVTPFSTTNAPEVMVRRHVILMNCDPLRAIVLRDRLLVLVPDGADSILETLSKRILGGREEMEDSVFGSSHGHDYEESTHSQPKPTSVIGKSKYMSALGRGGKVKAKVEYRKIDTAATDDTVVGADQSDESLGDEWDDLAGRDWIDIPFELKAVDAVLHTVTAMLAQDVETLQEAVYETIDEVVVKGRASAGDHMQQVLRALKNEIKEMSSRVENFVRAITESLDDLEDLSLMNLSRLLTHPERFIQPVPEEVLQEESDEPELILEVYMQQALSIYNQLDLLKGQVGTSEELMTMQLDSVRNRLLYINAVISVFTLSVSIAALVGSIYGMNVINGREEDPNAFNIIVTGTSLGCLGFLSLLLYIFYRALRLPTIQ